MGFELDLSYKQILQLLKVKTVLGFTLRHCHKRLVESYLYVKDIKCMTAQFRICRISNSCHFNLRLVEIDGPVTVMPTKSDSDAIHCLQLLSKTLTCTLDLS